MSLSISDLEIISVLKNQNRGLSVRRLSQVIQTQYTLSYTPSLSLADLRRLADQYPELIEIAAASWEDIVPFFDKSFLNGNQRARDPHKIFVNMKPSMTWG